MLHHTSLVRRIVPLEDQSAFLAWSPDTVTTFRHNFHQARALQPQFLGQILNSHPRCNIHLENIQRVVRAEQTGLAEFVPVNEKTTHPWIAAVQQGYLRVRVKQLLEYHPDLHGAVHGCFDEMEVRSRNFAALHRGAQLLLLPPRDQLSFDTEKLTTMFWQLTGKTCVESTVATNTLNTGWVAICGSHRRFQLRSFDDWSVILMTHHVHRRRRAQNLRLPFLRN